MIAIIGEEANRMERFIDDAVQISHTEADGLVVEKKPWNPARLIHGAIEEMGALSGRPVYLSVPASLPPAECDKEMIVRVLKQLLSNALKYSPDHSPLEISAQFTGAAIVIDVVDSGPGIGSEEKDRIFEKHYRGRAASGTKGTGLGLASARSIVRAHGGEVWATNRASGGAAFHVLLPLTAAPAAVAARKAGAL
jgi:two-component system sensor histidine kinase KdpD